MVCYHSKQLLVVVIGKLWTFTTTIMFPVFRTLTHKQYLLLQFSVVLEFSSAMIT